ncbi:MAG: sulfite exporter TauE/SafE family protein [Reinekea forsetii]|jgi:uncharacterized membrane protein YfcA|nr:sulfite exporter TauE/SafE family protein [Reinekea forsetii]MDO7674234.1 sulfite exporter TauE/SafE family protein [Reinekea forsetii]|tara:strand:- start:126 stop:884 length:759 start_codon:yes stop_codon:yes gene_type:complete
MSLPLSVWVDQVSQQDLILLVFASAITSLISALAGFGGGALLLGVMASFISPASLIAVHGLVQLGSNASRVYVFRRMINFRFVKLFMVGAVVGVLLATVVVSQLPEKVLLTFIALFVLLSAWLPARIPFKETKLQIAGLGALLTFLSLFVGATGPLLAAVLRTFDYAKAAFVGTLAFCILGQNILKVTAFSRLGFNITDWLPLVVLMIVAGFFGTWMGARLLGKIHEHHFKNLLKWVMTAIAINLLISVIFR